MRGRGREELELFILQTGDMMKVGEKVRVRGERELELSILQTGDMMKIWKKVRWRGVAGERQLSIFCGW